MDADLFQGVMTAPEALKEIAEDAVAFYWQERHQEEHALLHQVFLLNEFCTKLQEVFDQTCEAEIEVPDDIDFDLIRDVIPVVGQIYGHHPEGSYVYDCTVALRPHQGTRLDPDQILQLLPLYNDN